MRSYDAVVVATPIDLTRILKIKHPNTRVYYNLQEIGTPTVKSVLEDFLKGKKPGKKAAAKK